MNSESFAPGPDCDDDSNVESPGLFGVAKVKTRKPIAKFRPTSVHAAFFEAHRHIGRRLTRKLDHNTYLVRGNGRISVSFHDHSIISYNFDETITVSSCGYNTYTTRDRLNKFLPLEYRVFSSKPLQRKHRSSTSLFITELAKWTEPMVDGMILR